VSREDLRVEGKGFTLKGSPDQNENGNGRRRLLPTKDWGTNSGLSIFALNLNPSLKKRGTRQVVWHPSAFGGGKLDLRTVNSAPIRGIHPEVAPVWAIKG